MIVACHQPNYLPHLGFFHKMKEADVFVLLDSVQFSDGFYQHRNRIRCENGWKWLTVPVERSFQQIQNISIKHHVHLSERPWNIYHWDMIQHAYAKTPFFQEHAPALETIFKNAPAFIHLADFTIELITYLKNKANISTPLIRSSSLGIDAKDASERLAKITEAVGGTAYLTGPSGGTKYELHEEPFSTRGISIKHQEFSHPTYEQIHARYSNTFEKNLSSIDALFNVGKLPI